MRWLGVGLLLMGCAHAGATGAVDAAAPSAATRATIFSDPGLSTMYADAPRETERRVAQPVPAVLAALRTTFAAYGIPVTLDQPARGQVGNPDFYRSRQFLGKSMVELVSCGSTMTGPNAASYRIYLSMVATVRAQPTGGSSIGLLFTASARDIAGGTSVDRLPCGSTGLAENRFLDQLVTTLGAR